MYCGGRVYVFPYYSCAPTQNVRVVVSFLCLFAPIILRVALLYLVAAYIFYIYIYIYYSNKLRYLFIYLSIYLFVDIHIYVCVHMRAYVLTFIYIYIYIYILSHFYYTTIFRKSQIYISAAVTSALMKFSLKFFQLNWRRRPACS